MIDLRPMRPEDYVVAAGDSFPFINAHTHGRTLATSGPAFAGWDGDQLLGVAGVARGWPGVGEAWAILTDAGRRKPIAVCRMVRDGLSLCARAGRFRRVHADVISTFARGCRWVEALGFKAECVLERYGPNGEDFIRYVMFPGGKA